MFTYEVLQHFQPYVREIIADRKRIKSWSIPITATGWTTVIVISRSSFPRPRRRFSSTSQTSKNRANSGHCVGVLAFLERTLLSITTFLKRTLLEEVPSTTMLLITVLDFYILNLGHCLPGVISPLPATYCRTCTG